MDGVGGYDERTAASPTVDESLNVQNSVQFHFQY